MVQMEPRERPGAPKECKSTTIGANRSPRAAQYDPRVPRWTKESPKGASREPKEPKGSKMEAPEAPKMKNV